MQCICNYGNYIYIYSKQYDKSTATFMLAQSLHEALYVCWELHGKVASPVQLKENPTLQVHIQLDSFTIFHLRSFLAQSRGLSFCQSQADFDIPPGSS